MTPIIDPAKLDTETRDWLEGRPPLVRETFLAFPPGLYMMKARAPYGITAPGCKVVLLGHSEDGEAVVAVVEPNEASLKHAKMLAERHGRPVVDVTTIKAHVGTQWLELVELSPDIAVARIANG